MWQTVVVYIIGVVVFGYVIFKVYRMITRRSDPCIGCDGCELKSMMQKNNEDFQQKQNSCRIDGSNRVVRESSKGSSCGCGKS